MKDLIIQEFNNFIKDKGLNINLSFDMPSGYENAFGTFDIVDLTLYLNINKNCSKVRKLFTLFHELRHAEQYLNTNFVLDQFHKTLQSMNQNFLLSKIL